ncbi:hypothetical protein Cflav_PD5482 [Pedosphaera parvula Ellin514]|uniref:PilZ domain-containing protein n=1 Tax=Pedosphaera parvula (strain Ellin514) TaxID=320771 RepID=B9XBG2_PEDPL|nr:hypothetical protein Cflav_PD5482 [Pedosphaera parvula Ellin514]
MSARKLNSPGLFQPITVEAFQTRLLLAPKEVKVRRNGVEFRSIKPIAPWTEMTVTLQSNRDTAKVHCTGVVVACNGNRHTGYTVSMVFTDLSKQAQARLSILAYS